MRTIGIVAEYDPFHNGHKKQIELIKNHYKADFIVVVMSGPFMQRGEPSLFSVESRTKMALQNGVDMIFELPCLFALRDAEMFAYGAISILDSLGFVDGISFGVENENTDILKQLSTLVDDDDVIRQSVNNLKHGVSFAKARSNIILQNYGLELYNALIKPNNILAINYIKALNKLKSNMELFPVKREGDYHNFNIDISSPSASFIRNAYLKGDINNARKCCTNVTNIIIENDLLNYNLSNKLSLDNLWLYKIRNMTIDRIALVPGVAEGLENKIKKESASATTVSELLFKIKSKRYTMARLKRAFAYIMLDINIDNLNNCQHPEYVRLLGYKKRALPLIKQFKSSNINIITQKDFDNNNNSMLIDNKAYDIWSLSANKAIGNYFKAKVVIDC